MFTKYPNIFIEVQKKMRNNIAVGSCASFIIRRQDRLRAVELLISEVIFETLSTLEHNKVIK